MSGQAKEMKLNAGYSGVKEEKKYSFYEIQGLRRVLFAIEGANIKRSAKVDYWLNKNETAVQKAFDKYLNEESDLLKAHTVTYTNEKLLDKDKKPVVFVVYKGANDEDTLLNDRSAYFKLAGTEEEPMLDLMIQPTWKKEIPAAEEGGESTFQEMRYEPKFQSDDMAKKFEEELGKLQTEFSEPIETYLLKEENLDGLNVSWIKTENIGGRPMVTENLSEFRTLLYENLITK